jgi:hypothetical protein
MTKSPLKLVPPAIVKRTVTAPGRKPNAVYRTREHLTGAEVDRLIDAAKCNRWGHRDSTMILVAFRHGLRSSELTDLRWDQVDFAHAVLHVRRAKKGTPATHPVVGDEMRALRKLQREQDPKWPFVFTSERGSPFSFCPMNLATGSATPPITVMAIVPTRSLPPGAISDAGVVCPKARPDKPTSNAIERRIRFMCAAPVKTRLSGKLGSILFNGIDGPSTRVTARGKGRDVGDWPHS